MKPRVLLSSCAALLCVSAQAQIVTTGGILHTGYRGSLDASTDLSFSATAIADGVIGNGSFAPTHTVPNVNNGTYGNASSWIGGSYVGLSWGNVPQTIQSIAFSRDNTGVYGDRSAGIYTLQYTTADLSGLAIPGSGGTAGVVGTAADGAGWVTVGTMNYQGPNGALGNPTNQSYRNQFDLGFSLSGVTGVRLIAPGGAAIDQFEVYTAPVLGGGKTSQLGISAASGYTIAWDGNDGVHFTAADPAPVPMNLALGATAISSSDLGPEIGSSFHVKANLNDGLYGNNRAWIAGTGDNVAPFGGVTFNNGARHVSSVAWGRDNGNNATDVNGGQLTDRALGTYTLQSLDPSDGATWVTLGTFNYLGNDDTTVGAGFTSWLRHQYSIATAGGALRSAGIRLIVPPGGFGSNAIDELEVYSPTMTWTNGTASGKWQVNGDANFAGAADGQFLLEDSVHFGDAGAGTVVMEGALAVMGVTVQAASDYIFTGSGSIGGSGGLHKTGPGTLTLGGAHRYTGTTTVAAGTLVLDFSDGSSPVNNIVNQDANSSGLVLAGSDLVVVGRANSVNLQRFNGLTLRPGAATIALLNDPADNALALDLGAIERQRGSTVDFTLPEGLEDATNGVVTSIGEAGAILTANGVPFATIGGSDWAAQGVGKAHLTGLSSVNGYTESDVGSLSGNADIASGVDTSLAASTSISSLRFHRNEGRNVVIDAAQTLTVGGILVTSSVATAGSGIAGGMIAGAAGQDLVVIQNSPHPFTIGSVLADNTSATGLTKAGSGDLVLTGQSTMTGDVFVSSGTLTVTGGASANANGLGANVFGRKITIAPGATLVSTTTDSVDYFSTTVNQLAFRIQGTWENNPANTPGTGFQRVDNLTLEGATINDLGQHGGDHGGILMSGLVTVAGNAPSVYNQLGGGVGMGLLATTFDVDDVTGDADADFTINGATRNTPVGVGSLHKRGTGTMVLAGLNAYTGPTTVTGGTLSLQAGAVGTLNNVWIGRGARLSADVASGNNRHDLTGTLTLAGGTLSGNGNVSDTNTGQFFLSNAGQQVHAHGDVTSTISAPMHMAGAHIFNVDDGASEVDLLVTGQLSHQHLVSWGGVRKLGTGTMHLASSMDGTNAVGVNGIYGLGGFELANGTLLFSGSLGYSAFAPSNKSGYHLADFSGNAALKWAAGNTMDVSVNGNLRIRDGVTATFDTNGNDVTLATPIALEGNGTAGLIKAGAGTLTLPATNSLTGATTVRGGTLLINGSLSGSTTTVEIGGILGGSGVAGAVNVLAGGTIAPGNSAGVLTIGDLTAVAGSNLSFEVNTTIPGSGYDQLVVNGAVNLGGATLSLSGLYLAPVPGEIFYLILNDGADLIAGNFNGLAEGDEVFALGGQPYVITYQANWSGTPEGSSIFGGNDVALTAVPEPGAYVSLLGGLGLLLGRRRRR